MPVHRASSSLNNGLPTPPQDSGISAYGHEAGHLQLDVTTLQQQMGPPMGLPPASSTGAMASPHASATSQKHLYLIAKDDVFGSDGQTLLMRKGYRIPAEWVPKLIANGADPKLFVLENTAPALQAQSEAAAKPMVQDLKTFATVERQIEAPEEQLSGLQERLLKQHHFDVVVFDVDDKGLERSMQCLVKNGIIFPKIHPVSSVEHFRLALRRYNPAMVLVDLFLGNRPGSRYGLQQGLHGFNLLEQLSLDEDHRKRTVILTVSVPDPQTTLKPKIEASAGQYGAHVLFKPYSRFDLKPLVDLTAELLENNP